MTFAGFVLLGILLLAGVWYASHWSRRKHEAALTQLLARDRRLGRTLTPCGLTPDQLAAGFRATPRGDRRYGLRHGVSGRLALPVAAREVECEAASFQWWSEERQTTSDSNGTRTTYSERRTPVSVVRLPVTVPDRIVLTPESLFGRFGLTRGGHQLESSEFNRRFRVDGRDRSLTVRLLDAHLQTRLTEEFAGRTIEVVGNLLVLGGRPTHRDGSLHGVIGELPAMRQDLARLVDAFPAQFWRAVDAEQEA